MLSDNQAGPARPAFPYIGGKRFLARTIIAAIAETPHELYAEPFVGAGGVFLRRPEPAKVEVINDRSRDVATFFRVLQRHEQAFLDMLKWQLTSRADFERLLRTDPDTLTDLERAARFLYLQRTGIGAKIDGRNFGVTRTTGARFNLGRLVPIIEEVHQRLSRVVIECLNYDAFILRYDRPGALFYLDPPYYGCENYYGRGLFSRDDFESLAEALRQLRGRFLMSINDVPAIREIFAGFTLREVNVLYTAGQANHSEASELLISGPAA
ncbi:MAG TPA: DNA adenine methylase [Reyranella sp.]|nr:DNA adenine methylase [Reyranella sp.]